MGRLGKETPSMFVFCVVRTGIEPARFEKAGVPGLRDGQHV